MIATLDRLRIEQQASVLDLQRVLRNAVRFVPRLAVAGTAMELVVMPWTNDVFAVERAVPERTGNVIADARDGSKLPISIGERDTQRSRLDLAQGTIAQLVDWTEINPTGRFWFLCHQ